MAAVEQLGKVAESAIDGLKSSPSCLAAILLAAMFATMVYFSAKERDAQFHERQLALMQSCFPTLVEQAEQRRERQRERARAQREREGL